MPKHLQISRERRGGGVTLLRTLSQATLDDASQTVQLATQACEGGTAVRGGLQGST